MVVYDEDLPRIVGRHISEFDAITDELGLDWHGQWPLVNRDTLIIEGVVDADSPVDWETASLVDGVIVTGEFYVDFAVPRRVVSEILSAELAACIATAREQGWVGEDGDYEHTAEDLEYVTEVLGRKPTREEWRAAGLHWVGSYHWDA